MPARRAVPADTVPLDWSHAPVRDPAPCRLCGQPSFLRHPITGLPCHKCCSDLHEQETNR